MSWRVARSLDVLLNEINEAAPQRDKYADGSIGDQAHASRKSDHNPDANGIVKARDITHDPAAGADMHDWAEAIKDDPRLGYIIFARRIWNPSISRSWRPYSGSNPHDRHMHVSVHRDVDNPAPWAAAVSAQDDPWEMFMATLTDKEQDVVKSFARQLVRMKTTGDSFARQLLTFHRTERPVLQEMIGHIQDKGTSIQGLVRGATNLFRAAKDDYGVDTR